MREFLWDLYSTVWPLSVEGQSLASLHASRSPSCVAVPGHTVTPGVPESAFLPCPHPCFCTLSWPRNSVLSVLICTCLMPSEFLTLLLPPPSAGHRHHLTAAEVCLLMGPISSLVLLVVLQTPARGSTLEHSLIQNHLGAFFALIHWNDRCSDDSSYLRS